MVELISESLNSGKINIEIRVIIIRPKKRNCLFAVTV